MSSLAQYLHYTDYEVSGCDLSKSSVTDLLEQKGIKVYGCHNLSHLDDVDLVVYTSAVSPDNCEINYCKQQGIKTISREMLLGNIFNGYENSVAIAGAHGKTTACGLLIWAFQHCGVYPTAFVGGLVNEVGNFILGQDDCCIAEACEYKGGFLTLKQKIGVILNIDLEHLDYYSQLKDIEKAFNGFALNTNQSGVVIVNGDSVPYYVLNGVKAKKLTFGFNKNNYYHAANVKQQNAKYSFDFVRDGRKVGRCSLSIVGRHNIYNALAALSVCDYLGLPLAKAIAGVSKFSGTKRRFMLVENSFTEIVEDYAHHPNEIKELVATAKQCGYEKIIVVFQPHTYSRTQKLFLDFVTCFLGVDQLILLPIYPAREPPISGISSQLLADTINQAGILPTSYCNSFSSAEKLIRKTAGKDDLVLIVGAGDINKLSEMLSKSK